MIGKSENILNIFLSFFPWMTIGVSERIQISMTQDWYNISYIFLHLLCNSSQPPPQTWRSISIFINYIILIILY